jgi:hypothetical protein
MQLKNPGYKPSDAGTSWTFGCARRQFYCLPNAGRLGCHGENALNKIPLVRSNYLAIASRRRQHWTGCQLVFIKPITGRDHDRSLPKAFIDANRQRAPEEGIPLPSGRCALKRSRWAARRDPSVGHCGKPGKAGKNDSGRGRVFLIVTNQASNRALAE